MGEIAGRRILSRHPTHNASTSKRQKTTEINITYNKDKLFKSKSPKAKGHLNTVCEINEIHIKIM